VPEQRPTRSIGCEIGTGGAGIAPDKVDRARHAVMGATTNVLLDELVPVALSSAGKHNSGGRDMRRVFVGLATVGFIMGGLALPSPVTVQAASPPPAVAAVGDPPLLALPSTGGTITGRATDSRGVPSAGRTVRLNDYFFNSTTTAADGTFTFRGLADGSYRVSLDTGFVNYPSFSTLLPYPELVTVAGGSVEAGVNFTVPDRAIVTGTVHSTDGRPIKGALIIGTDNSYSPVITGADGRYVAVTRPGTQQLRAYSPEFIGDGPMSGLSGAGTTQVDAAAGQETTVDFVVDPGASISGRISDTAGASPVGRRVNAVSASGSSRSAEIDPTGHYRIRGLAEGDYIVNVFGDSNNPYGPPSTYFPGTSIFADATPVHAGTSSAETVDTDFTVAPAQPGPLITATSISPRLFIRGTATEAVITGSGFVAGSDLRFDTFNFPVRPTITVLEVLDSEHVRVLVTSAPDNQLGDGYGMLVTQRDHSIECGACTPYVIDQGQTAGTISGHVTSTATGLPVGLAMVRAVDVVTQRLTTVQTDASGAYRLDPLIAGQYRVTFDGPSQFLGGTERFASEVYPDAHITSGEQLITVTDGDVPGIDAALEPATPVTLTSATPNTLQPGVATDVVLTGTGFNVGQSVFASGSSNSFAAAAVTSFVSSTEAHVRFTTPADAPSGPLQVFISGSGGFVGCACLSIAPRSPTQGIVNGAVTDANGAGLGSVRVSAFADGQTEPVASTWTTADGAYAVRLSSGSYTVRATDAVGVSVEATSVTIGTAATTAVDLTLNSTATLGAISGHVSFGYGPIYFPTTEVRAVNVSSGAAYITSSGPNGMGAYRLGNLPTGDYHVQFIAGGMATQWFNSSGNPSAATTVTVTSGGETTAIDAVLTSAISPLTVTGLQPSRLALGEDIIGVAVSGSGFFDGNVGGLSFDAGPGVTVGVVSVSFDDVATLQVMVDPTAALGPRDIVAVRGDGETATCTGCLTFVAQVGSIAGFVGSPNWLVGIPQPSYVVAESTTSTEAFYKQTNPDGTYVFDHLPVGDYTVHFVAAGFDPQWYNLSSTAAAAQIVTVGPSGLTGIDGELEPSRRSLYAYAYLSTGQATTLTAQIGGQGFLFGGVTGLAFDAGPGVTVDIIDIPSDNVANVNITVAADAPMGTHQLIVSRSDGSISANCCITITPPPGSITGKVTGSGGLPLAGAFVTLNSNGFGFRTVVTDATGRYVVNDLQPGSYTAQFSAAGYQIQYFDGATTSAAATPIVVNSGATAVADVHLQIQVRPLIVFNLFYTANSGASRSVQLFGDGFLTGVTGLAFSSSPGITFTVDKVPGDNAANVTIAVDASVASGFYNIVATRDGGAISTCFSCLYVSPPPPSYLNVSVLDADTSQSMSGQLSVTKVGATTPTFSGFVSGFASLQVDPGQYDVTVEAQRYSTATQRVTVGVGQFANVSFAMQTPRQPLTLQQQFFPAVVYQGYSYTETIVGSGFRSGGVTGLSFTAGPDVTVTVDSIISDSAASITVSAAPSAQTGLRDLVVTRDGGESATCTGCVDVQTPPPGSVSGAVYSYDVGSYVSALITLTRVGESTPTVTVLSFNFFTAGNLPPGDYTMLVEAPAHDPYTQPVTVRPGADTSLGFITVSMVRQPLTLTGSQVSLIQGTQANFVSMIGSGFRAGAVSNLTVSAGDGVTASLAFVSSDSFASFYFTVDPNAAPGPRDLTIARDDGRTATCAGCLVITEPPGYVNGNVTDAETGASLYGAIITATRVGDSAPTATTYAYYGPYSMALPPGDYVLRFDAGYYATEWWDNADTESSATIVTVNTGSTFTADAALRPTPVPLYLSTYNNITQGESQQTLVYGSGFLIGGVTALAFDAGPGVTITVDQIASDNYAYITLSAAATAADGYRDITVSRAGGDTYTCYSCLYVYRGVPTIQAVTQRTVKGELVVTVSGQFLQSVTSVTSSSTRARVLGYTNNRNGTVSVRLKTREGRRTVVTLWFTRDDGTAYSVDFTLRNN
jgi:hypothetical protein